MKAAIRLVVCGLLVLAAFAGGCSRKERYSQATPEATIRTARLMVERGEVEKLPTLIYSESKEFSALMKRFGILLSSVSDLASTVQEKFPAEVAALRAPADEGGDKPGFLAQLAQSQGRRFNPGNAAQEEAFGNLVKQIFADPFGWLAQGEQRLSVEEIDDSRVAVLLDGEPVLAPVGLIMRKDVDDKWAFVLPTQFPGLGDFMPRSRQEYSIVASLFKVFDNAVKDLDADVKAGRIANLEDLSRAAGEKAFIPAVMTYFAYTKAIEARNKAAASVGSPQAGGAGGAGGAGSGSGATAGAGKP
ncbi:MAG: hypothetical protein SFZ23_06790 [Planctomycetota bacterium]|nr:hypothetical protein [Planctomycetota bacterium]